MFLVLLISSLAFARTQEEGFASLKIPPPFPTNISVNLYLKYIEDVDESAGYASFVYYVELTRWEEKLVDNPKFPFGSQNCIFDLAGVWMPKSLVFVNNILSQTISPGFGVDLAVCRNGAITTSTYFRVSVSAIFHSADFPFDSQWVEVNFANLMSGGEFVDLQPAAQSFEEMERKGYKIRSNMEWELVGYSCAKKEDLYPGHHLYSVYPYIECGIRLRRFPLYYVISFCLPCLIVSILSISGIRAASSPFTSGPKGTPFQLCLMTLMAISVLALSISGQIPKTGEIARIHIFYFGMMTLVCLAPFNSWMISALFSSFSADQDKAKLQYLKFYDSVSYALLVVSLVFLLMWLVV